MTAFLPKQAEIFVSGYDLACAFTEMNVSKSTGEKNATTLCNNGNSKWIPGRKEGSLSFNGFYDYDAIDLNKVENILDTAFENQADLIVSASLVAIVVGEMAYMVRGCQNEKNVENAEDEIVAISAVLRPKENISLGLWVYKGSADDDTDEGDSVDNAAASTNGGVLHFHQYLEDDSTATDGEILVEHSVGDSVWVTLISTPVGTSFPSRASRRWWVTTAISLAKPSTCAASRSR